MHCMLMDLLHGFEVLSTTEETLFNSRNVSRLVQNNIVIALVQKGYRAHHCWWLARLQRCDKLKRLKPQSKKSGILQW